MITVSIKDDTAGAVADQVYRQLWSEQGLRTTTADITIEAAEGAVALNGRVRTRTLRGQAERLARAGVNGWQLHNNLIADDQLAMDLAASLVTDPRTASARVRFEVFLGVVYLTGTADSEQQRAAVVEVVSRAANVIKIEDYLVIVR